MISKFPDLEIYQNHPLAPRTTLKIGGPADIFVNLKTQDQILPFYNLVHQFTTIGNGSNLLISDSGIRGLVVKNSVPDIRLLDNSPVSAFKSSSPVLRQENSPDQYLDLTKLDYDESDKPIKLVKVCAGTPLPQLINWTLDHGLTGLQWFGYIPGSVGGAIWCNIHGGKHNFNEFVDTIEVFNRQINLVETLVSSDLSWAYDSSPFQTNPDLIILSATLKLFQGDVELAKNVKNAWIAQKAQVQPMNSAGSVFKNPPLEACLPIWNEQKSTGWIIDNELHLKNHRLGDAQIGPQHANIFTNQGHATAKDFMGLINLVQAEAKAKFNLDLEPEIKFMGKF